MTPLQQGAACELVLMWERGARRRGCARGGTQAGWRRGAPRGGVQLWSRLPLCTRPSSSLALLPSPTLVLPTPPATMGNCFTCIETSNKGVITRCGKYDRIADAGCMFLNPCTCEHVAGLVSLKIQEVGVQAETKTKVGRAARRRCAPQARAARAHPRAARPHRQSACLTSCAHVACACCAIVGAQACAGFGRCA